ncbi:hypothetical protein BamMEX5DRAFT_2899 [Burkholderia ambifaria MEX-5]|uniref:Uncharacterized protein n=1 Tax=Burkholderia ambifaria MEX-5 TaxID=396597 RepID=B1T533_9BURK|nr:hypothetical protein BamMEX5DRAFT_2899 [Burkholderia ambifaria MEX-5]
MRRVDQETRRTGIRERGEVRAPPRGQRVVRGVFADLGMRGIHFMCGAARIDQRVVVRALHVPVRMLGAQRVVTRDAVRHHFEQHAQPVAVRELREPRERLERAGARRERRGRQVEVGDVAWKPRDAGGPEAADQHVVEAHAGDVRERVGPCIERADEAGVAEVDVRSEGRCGVHGWRVRVAAGSATGMPAAMRVPAAMRTARQALPRDSRRLGGSFFASWGAVSALFRGVACWRRRPAE